MIERYSGIPGDLPWGLERLHKDVPADAPDLASAIKRTRILWVLQGLTWPASALAVGPFIREVRFAGLAGVIVILAAMHATVRRGTWLRAAMSWSKTKPELGFAWLAEAIDLRGFHRRALPGQMLFLATNFFVLYQILFTPSHLASPIALIAVLAIAATQGAYNISMWRGRYSRFAERLGKAFPHTQRPAGHTADEWRSERRF